MARRAAVLAALLVAGEAVAKDPSPVIYPPQRMPLRFSHRQHLAFKLDCDFCHESAPGSVSAADHLAPPEDACTTCHQIDRTQFDKQAKPPARCDACHVYDRSGAPAEPPAVDIPAPNIKFNHKVHVDRDIPCQRCHGSMQDVDLATRKQLPLMPLCLGCHNRGGVLTRPEAPPGARNTRAPARCSTCHVTQFDGTLQTEFPAGRLVPSGTLKGDQHTLDFATRHAQVGRDEAAYCETCHRKDFCLSCHNGVVKPMGFHGNDYLVLHGIEARKATLQCDGCHRRQTFCLGCHERVGVTDPVTALADTHLGPGRRFHPPAVRWVDGPRLADHHSWQAERNIKQCIACHREESCIQCHATAGVAGAGGVPAQIHNVSPHPTAFGATAQCRALAARNPRVCLKCHAVDDPHRTCM